MNHESNEVPADGRLCAGRWTGVDCSRRMHCLRHKAIEQAPQKTMVYAALCPGLDEYWPAYIKAA